MFESQLSSIRQAYSGDAAKHHVAAISRFHRIQASPGYREAAQYVYAQLQAAGLDTELQVVPADNKARFWTLTTFQEWSCSHGTLDLIKDDQFIERLCDYNAVPISLIQRSTAIDGTFEVVVLEDGTQDAHYQDLEVEGKIVLTNGNLQRVVDMAVRRRGAAGILFDGMAATAPGRGPLDLPDARQYTSFWWGAEWPPCCFGFVLTPRQGQRLRDSAPFQVKARVESHIFDGEIEIVSAFIPGKNDQEVLIVSHLCHPQPSANDNASGAAANLEIAATLQRLIDQGELAPPSHGIRFIWVPEMSGTYIYLASHEERIPRTLAAINLDMVGQDQEQCRSTFNIEEPPDAMASFAPVLLKQLWQLLLDQEGNEEKPISLLRHAVVPFSGGSDHYILSDPTVGIPTPMLIQWPDRFYHTSADTLDRVDPQWLARAGSLAAAYAYGIATMGSSEAIWLIYATVADYQENIQNHAQAAISKALSAESQEALAQIHQELQRAIPYLTDRGSAALHTILRLWPAGAELIQEQVDFLQESAGDGLARATEVIERQLRVLGGSELPDVVEEQPWRAEACQLVPERLYRGPISFFDLMAKLSEEERDAFWQETMGAGRASWTARTLAEYWADGQLTVAEIADRVQLETGVASGERVLAYFQALAERGVVKL
ncbi:MAG: DUF4910 domain-containing protein [Chloroflexota bacterium]|nr:DUF4910 domain-containing protein [Chloroflexota bacterium]